MIGLLIKFANIVLVQIKSILSSKLKYKLLLLSVRGVLNFMEDWTISFNITNA